MCSRSPATSWSRLLVIFAALASTIATQGLGIIVVYAKFVGGFYLSLAILWALLLAASTLAVGKRLPELIQMVREPALIAFSTATSEAAYPGLLEGLQRFGAPRKIVSFVLPLGYSFNLDGSTMYTTFAALFIAQAYGIHLTLGQQMLMMAILMITSKGIAGVPRASLVVIMAVLPYFHIPLEGIALVLRADHLLDMGRSATNVVGNSVATVIVSKWRVSPCGVTDHGREAGGLRRLRAAAPPPPGAGQRPRRSRSACRSRSRRCSRRRGPPDTGSRRPRSSSAAVSIDSRRDSCSGRR